MTKTILASSLSSNIKGLWNAKWPKHYWLLGQGKDILIRSGLRVSLIISSCFPMKEKLLVVVVCVLSRKGPEADNIQKTAYVSYQKLFLSITINFAYSSNIGWKSTLFCKNNFYREWGSEFSLNVSHHIIQAVKLILNKCVLWLWYIHETFLKLKKKNDWLTNTIAPGLMGDMDK